MDDVLISLNKEVFAWFEFLSCFVIVVIDKRSSHQKHATKRNKRAPQAPVLTRCSRFLYVLFLYEQDLTLAQKIKILVDFHWPTASSRQHRGLKVDFFVRTSEMFVPRVITIPGLTYQSCIIEGFLF